MKKSFVDFEDWEMLIIEDNMEGISDIFNAAIKKRYNLVDFSFYFLTSDIFKNYFDSISLYSQSAGYVLECFEEEMKQRKITLPISLGLNPENLEKATEIGNVFAWWKQIDDEYPENEIRNIDFSWLCDNIFLLTTQDYDNAIDRIEEHIKENEIEKE